MAMKTTNLLALATLASAALASSAHAHINATIGDASGRNGNMKNVPCDGMKGTALTYEPGTTVEIKVLETIPHPGYFRIAFDDDGADFVEPRSISPVNPARKCPSSEKDQCGEPDFCNNETVLWDNLAPHPSAAPFTSYTWKIKLPDIECDNCTLQVIQVMEDDDLHGPYCPKDIASCNDPSYIEDNYHRCFDITLKKGAKNGPGASKDPVSLPADKKYVDCSKQTPGEPTATTDAGSDSGQPKSDAGEAPSEPTDDVAADDDDDDDTGGETGTKIDAGVKKDAGVKRDAGKASSDDEDEGDETSVATKEDGCALASSGEGAAWTLLAFGLLLSRRRRMFV
jgi:MYXO-CTERM domain-containing protein